MCARPTNGGFTESRKRQLGSSTPALTEIEPNADHRGWIDGEAHRITMSHDVERGDHMRVLKSRKWCRCESRRSDLELPTERPSTGTSTGRL